MTDSEPVVVDPLDAAPERYRQIAAERVAALQLVEQLEAERGSVVAAVGAAAEAIGVSARSIALWRSQVRGFPRSDWAAALLPRWHGRESSAECSDEAWRFLLGAYARPGEPSFTDAYRRLVDVAPMQGWVIPSEKVLRLRVQREVTLQDLTLRRKGVDALEAQYPAQRRDRTCFHALQAVNADGHRWDVQVLWPDGEIARPMAVVFQDLFSGKITSYRVDRTENASAIRLAFGDTVEQYGIPSVCYLDNGRGFASKWMTGQMKHRFRFKITPEEPKGIMSLLNVAVHWCTPYHGQAKPIERCFRDLCETIARHPSFSGAYTGNSPAHKPSNYGTRTIPLVDFLRVVELEIKAHNARQGRRTRACQGELSFDEAFERSYSQAPIRKVSEVQRRLLLLAAEGLKVRQGGLHLMGNEFWCPQIASHMGESVVVRFDPEHVQRGVYVYDLGGKYLGFAECSAAVGFDDVDAAREHSRKKRSWAKAEKKRTRELGALEEAEVGRLHIAALESKYGETAAPASKVVRPIFGRGTKPATVVAPSREEIEQDDEQAALFERIGSRARRRLNVELSG